MTSNSVKAGISHEQLIFALDRIIDTPDLHAELLTRAMIIRVSELCVCQPGAVKDINNAPASDTVKQKGFHSSKSALSMHEEAATTNGAAVNFTHTMVRRSLGYSLGEGEWLKVCKALPNLDRDDLYFSLKGLTQSVFRAVSMDDAVGLRECLPALNETLSLGEWGKIFYDKWWKAEEGKLVGSALWRRACVGIWSAPFMPEPLQHANTAPPPSSNSNSMAKTVAGVVGKAAIRAVVQSII
jgi:hypothetical protein